MYLVFILELVTASTIMKVVYVHLQDLTTLPVTVSSKIGCFNDKIVTLDLFCSLLSYSVQIYYRGNLWCSSEYVAMNILHLLHINMSLKWFNCMPFFRGIVNDSLRPQIPSWCDPEWKALMESCWSSDPTGRPSFTDISQRLRKMAASMNVK